MTEDDFWQIIEDCRASSNGNFAEQIRLQREHLLQLPVEELLSFTKHWDTADDLAFTWPVWDVAALLLGGCGDETFSDFRAWLIGQGREALEQVANTPDTLADLADRWTDSTPPQAEEFGMLAYSAYEELTGSCDMPTPQGTFPHDPTGTGGNIATQALARLHYPRMAARHYGPE